MSEIKWTQDYRKHMQTAVKVSLGPHRQTKDIQHLSCLLTCWCKSRKPVAMSSRGVQTTQRRLNPPRRQMRKERQEKRVFDATLLSDFFICSSLISVWPKESDSEPPGLQETRGKSLSHIEPRLFFFFRQCKFPNKIHCMTVSQRWEEARCCRQ